MARFVLDTELSQREVLAIGSIITQWGFLESDIFEQAIQTFSAEDALPASMRNNAHFSKVLKVWKKRVAEQQTDDRRKVLLDQYDQIIGLIEFRQAVVHSRWEWKPESPKEITAVRIHNHKIKRVRFTSDDLADFSSKLGEIRYWIRYPGGLEDHAEEMTRQGGFVSREWMEAMIAGKPDEIEGPDEPSA